MNNDNQFNLKKEEEEEEEQEEQENKQEFSHNNEEEDIEYEQDYEDEEDYDEENYDRLFQEIQNIEAEQHYPGFQGAVNEENNDEQEEQQRLQNNWNSNLYPITFPIFSGYQGFQLYPIDNNDMNISNTHNNIYSNEFPNESIRSIRLLDILQMAFVQDQEQQLVFETGILSNYQSEEETLENQKISYLKKLLDMLHESKNIKNDISELEIQKGSVDCVLTYEEFMEKEDIYILDDCFSSYFKFDTLEQIFTVQKSYLNPCNQLPIQRILKFCVKFL